MRRQARCEHDARSGPEAWSGGRAGCVSGLGTARVGFGGQGRRRQKKWTRALPDVEARLQSGTRPRSRVSPVSPRRSDSASGSSAAL